MIITRTPLRISFLGGGTDYPSHFREHGGQTLGAAIDKYSYVTVHPLAPLGEHTIRVSYSKTELARSLDEVEHPAVRECLRFLGLHGGLEINYVGDLPARTGLGSSSSFTVALLHALHAFKGELVSRDRLAAEAVHVEQEMIRERVGVQDQYTCAHGGLVHLRFSTDGAVAVYPVPMPAPRLDELRAHLMLLYTGIRRHAHGVVEEQLERTRRGEVRGELERLAALVDEGRQLLAGGGPLRPLGELLDAAWSAKKRLSSQITSGAIDSFYDRARRAGAIGGKLLGAGAGGFLLIFAEPERQAGIEAAVPELRRVRFDFDHAGSTVLFYQP